MPGELVNPGESTEKLLQLTYAKIATQRRTIQALEASNKQLTESHNEILALVRQLTSEHKALKEAVEQHGIHIATRPVFEEPVKQAAPQPPTVSTTPTNTLPTIPVILPTPRDHSTPLVELPRKSMWARMKESCSNAWTKTKQWCSNTRQAIADWWDVNGDTVIRVTAAVIIGGIVLFIVGGLAWVVIDMIIHGVPKGYVPSKARPGQ